MGRLGGYFIILFFVMLMVNGCLGDVGVNGELFNIVLFL